MKTNEKTQRLTKALRDLSIAHGFVYDAKRSAKWVKKSLMTETERVLDSVSALFDVFDKEFGKLQKEQEDETSSWR